MYNSYAPRAVRGRKLVEDGARPRWSESDEPIGLGVAATGRWTHVLVRDPDPRPIQPAEPDEELPENGRGLAIVDGLSRERWEDCAIDGKTVHAVIARPGVTLTAEELEALRR